MANIDFLVHSQEEIDYFQSQIAGLQSQIDSLQEERRIMVNANYQAKRQQEIKQARKMTTARAAVLEQLCTLHKDFANKRDGMVQTVYVGRSWNRSGGHYARFTHNCYDTFNPRPQVVEDLYQAGYIYRLKESENEYSSTKVYAISDDGCDALDAWRLKQQNKGA